MSAYIYSELLHAEPSDNEYGTPGYHIEKGDGIYWEPKEIFERHALKVEDNPKLPSGVSIGPTMVDNFIKEVHSITMGDRTTVTRVILVNGFEIMESSSCVDPANYSQEMGETINLGHVKDKIWELLGFLLSTAYHGFENQE